VWMEVIATSQFYFHISRVEVYDEQFLDSNNQMREGEW
jgi:hypothetical protein